MSLAEILTWGYFIGTAVSWPILARAGVRYDRNSGPLDGEDIVTIIIATFMISFFWPFMIPAYWIWEWLQKEITTGEED